MSLRILHTADNHIGVSYNQYPEVRERLVEERFGALERLVGEANRREAHFFVVAGDLFDKQSVTKAVVERAVGVLAGFEGEAALVLAGNHDFCEGPDNKLWRHVRGAAEGTCVVPLTEQGTREFSGDDYRVRFYACPCPSKHGTEHRIGWVAEEEKPEGMQHIGLAHGNVEGLGLDANHRYFNMSEADFREAGLDTWLLGHIHVPAPDPGMTGRPLFYMPGIHTPDSVRCSHPGHAWWIELDAEGGCRHKQLSTGKLRFVRITRALTHPDAIADLRASCEELDAPNTILDLQLTGRLEEEALADLNELLKDLGPRFLHLSREQDIAPVLKPEDIARRYPEETLPNALLNALLEDAEHPGDAHLAMEILESTNS